MRIVDLLERSYLLYKNKLAVFVFDEEEIKYSDLRNRSISLANSLKLRGIKKNDRIILLADNSSVYFYLSFACSYLGASLVPLNTGLSQIERDYIISNAEPALIVVDKNNKNNIKKVKYNCDVLFTDKSIYSKYLNSNYSENILYDSRESDINLIIYTSGTTGKPKGVCLSQKALYYNAMTACISQNLNHSDKFLSMTPLYHASAGVRIFTMIIDGQTHYVMNHFDPNKVIEHFYNYKLTTTIAVPNQISRILNSKKFDKKMLNSLRLLVYGAAPTNLKLIKKLISYFPNKLCQGYGLTETVSQLTCLTPNDHILYKNNDQILMSVGREISGVKIEIRNNKGKSIFNEVGEICVQTEKIMHGYWQNSKETKKVLDNNWFKTGDLGIKDDNGYIQIVGRSKDMIISGGVNLYPLEIENTLIEYSCISEAAVIGINSDEWGEIPYAFIKLKGTEQFDEMSLKMWLEDRLTKYKIPKFYQIINKFPKTRTGKIMKHKLKVLINES